MSLYSFSCAFTLRDAVPRSSQDSKSGVVLSHNSALAMTLALLYILLELRTMIRPDIHHLYPSDD